MRASDSESPLFSILIPSWNNLPFLRLCVESIRKNSTFRHQIIIHVNEGSDGTLDWVKKEGLDYTYSARNIGVCLAMNSMRPKVKTEYMLFINDDMYVLPEWDKILAEEIRRLPDNRFFLSSTTIQPHTPGNVIVADYGDSVENFEETRLLAEYKNLHKTDWMGATLPPNIVHRDIWDLVGGYSVEYSPGMYSDPDFSAKLWLCGVRYMKGLGESKVYHFETKSTGRIKKNDGRMQFLMKWGLTSSSFRKVFTHKGKDFAERLLNAYNPSELEKRKLRSRIESLHFILRKPQGPLWKFSENNPAGEGPKELKGGEK